MLSPFQLIAREALAAGRDFVDIPGLGRGRLVTATTQLKSPGSGAAKAGSAAPAKSRGGLAAKIAKSRCFQDYRQREEARRAKAA